MTGGPVVWRVMPDGSLFPIGEVVDITCRLVKPDGTEVAPRGACPLCARRPMNDDAVICPHGVALK
jgi:hypothetical protein